jgi:hypothetical protein
MMPNLAQRNVTMQKWGFLANSRYLLHDRDTKFCISFRQLIEAGRVKTMPLPARSPNLNAYAERWVRSVKQECLSKLIFVWGEAAAPSPAAICDPLPRGAQSPGQAEPTPVPLAESRGKWG